jgi:hypothetical protein
MRTRLAAIQNGAGRIHDRKGAIRVIKVRTFLARATCAVASAAVALLVGCASPGGGTAGGVGMGPSSGVVASEATAATTPRVGFLTDYAKLAAMPGGGGMLCWRSADTDWKRYDKVLFERIQVYIKPGSQQPVDPTDLKAMIDYFHGALVKAIKPEAQVVDALGPGVLRVQIALTSLVPTNTVASLAGTAMPYGFVAEIGSGAVTGRPAGSTPYLGLTGLEVKFRDGGSG